MAFEVRELIDSIDGIVWEVDVATFRFTFVSQQAERLLGYPRDAWYEPDFWVNILHPDDRGWAVEFCRSQTREMKAHVFEYRAVARDGRALWLRDLVSVIVSEGRPVSLRGIMIDVTALKAAEADRDRLLTVEQTLRAAAELEQERAAFLADASRRLAASLEYEPTLRCLAQLSVPFLADWCMTAISQADGSIRLVTVVADSTQAELARELEQGRPELEAPGLARVTRTLTSELYPRVTDETRRTASDAWSMISARDPRHLETIRRLGMTSCMAVPLAARGRPLGALMLVSGREDRSYGPGELAFAEDLAHRAALALDNALLYQEAQAALRVRDEFMSIASHELRTPVTSLQLLVQALTSGLVPMSPEQMARALPMIGRQTDRLTRLIDDLLDVSRIQAGRLPLLLEEVDLCVVLKDIAEQFRGDLERARCRVEIHAERPVTGSWDRQRLEQVVSNLLSNAIKFAPGSVIEMTVVESDGVARLVVEDHGVGIDPARLPHLFQRFERAVSAKNYGGLGLGLFITRSIVEALGGAIRVQSAPGEGTTFTVELPRRVEVKA